MVHIPIISFQVNFSYSCMYANKS